MVKRSDQDPDFRIQIVLTNFFDRVVCPMRTRGCPPLENKGGAGRRG